MEKIFAIVGFALAVAGSMPSPSAAEAQTVQLVISGGHETDPQDHGRPVVLVGNALGVTPEIFREAFSHVSPAPAGTRPDGERVHNNKTALMGALSKYGVTNERLDEVSNFYRYQPGGGRLWITTSAIATATLKDGEVSAIKIVRGGSGYSSEPKITAPGHPEIAFKSKVVFGKDLKANGSISEITVADTKKTTAQK